MAVTEQTPINSYTGNGSSTVFPYSFRLLAEADLVVQINGATQTLGVHYTVSGVGNDAGGDVTFITAPGSGLPVVIYRDTDLLRATDYQDNGDLLAAVVNRDFDRLWMALQDIYGGGKAMPSALRVPNGETVATLPNAATRANRVLAFNGAGQPTLIVGVDAGSAAALSADLANGVNPALGSALVGHRAAGVGASARTLQAKLRDHWVSVKDFGAVGNGVTDDTAAILAADAHVFSGGGGTVYFPPGIYAVTSLSVDRGTSNISVFWVGAGQRATALLKIGSTTTPIVHWQTTGATDGVYAGMENMTIAATSTTVEAALRLTRIARFKARSLYLSGCAIGLDLVGALINSFYDLDINNNLTGVRTTKSGLYYANLNAFFGGGIRGNTTWAMDLNHTNGFYVYGTDIEYNATPANLATGQLIIRGDVSEEIGYSNIRFSGCWFEGGAGRNIVVEADPGLNLVFSDVPMIASEGGRVMEVGNIQRLVLERVVAGSPSDTVTIAATESIIRDSTIGALSDTSTRREYSNLITATGSIQHRRVDGVQQMNVAGNRQNSGSGSVATTSGVAATIFGVDTTVASMYEVFAYIDNLGLAAYNATARIACDRAGTFRMGGENGANLTITVSGSNVQVTQTSGAGQTVSYRYHRIG